MTPSSLFELFAKQSLTHAKLISKGVDNRTALEIAFGKEHADNAVKTLADIEKKQPTINKLNN